MIYAPTEAVHHEGLGDPRHPEAGRPEYPTPEHYLEHVADALDQRRRPWAPATPDELNAVAAAYPELCRRWAWWPGPAVRAEYGLPDDPPSRPEPLDETERLRLVEALRRDPDLCEALAVLIGGAR